MSQSAEDTSSGFNVRLSYKSLETLFVERSLMALEEHRTKMAPSGPWRFPTQELRIRMANSVWSTWKAKRVSKSIRGRLTNSKKSRGTQPATCLAARSVYDPGI